MTRVICQNYKTDSPPNLGPQSIRLFQPVFMWTGILGLLYLFTLYLSQHIDCLWS